MKPVEINPDTVNLELKHTEFHGLRDALTEAVEHLEEGLAKRKALAPHLEGVSDEDAYDILYQSDFPEDDAKEFAQALKHDEALLEQFRALSSALKKITKENGLERFL
jgi:hypothetical protein